MPKISKIKEANISVPPMTKTGKMITLRTRQRAGILEIDRGVYPSIRGTTTGTIMSRIPSGTTISFKKQTIKRSLNLEELLNERLRPHLKILKISMTLIL
jgi:hypothetical protein